MKRLSITDLESELAALEQMKTPALQSKWREVFGSEPPRKMRAGFLQRAIAYRLQEQIFGGLKPKTRRELQRRADALRAARSAVGTSEKEVATPPRRPVLSPGTRLLREWNGRTEMVEVTANGFVWKSETFRTLSAVAVAITGTKWSGPKFFGLDKKPAARVASRKGGSVNNGLGKAAEEVAA